MTICSVRILWSVLTRPPKLILHKYVQTNRKKALAGQNMYMENVTVGTLVLKFSLQATGFQEKIHVRPTSSSF